ncbi:MAG: Crp/Fnr family transcriptional regulator [Chitinispirillaceae bacterium]
MQTSRRSQLKTGRRPLNRATRTFKDGEVICEEGSLGREMFIIEKGSVGVFKNGENGRVKLATVGENGIIGEMSILDNLPRSATVIAQQQTSVTLINESIFKNTLQKAPIWLTSIVKIVVSRLRDANRRASQSPLRDKKLGILSLIRLLLSESGCQIEEKQALSLNVLLLEAFYVSRLSKKEVNDLLEGLQRRQIIEIVQGSDKAGYIRITDREALDLYHEYLELRRRKKTFREASLHQQTVTTLSNIAYLAQKSGRPTEDGVVLSKSILVQDFSDKKNGSLDSHLIELKRLGVLYTMPEQDDTLIVFHPETVRRIGKIKEWLPRFKEAR